MYVVTPSSSEDLANALHRASKDERTISVVGAGTKGQMGGPSLPADITICTSGLKRVLAYEPGDLTLSVEAGHNFADLQNALARHRQMIALDPPFYPHATIGGIVASNSSGPMRRAFGTARDLVIGMKFAMLNGKSATAGGMVVKNVAGLDIGKLIIGSFGTLGVITSVNFRLHALPENSRTFLYSFGDLKKAFEKRDSIVRSPLCPLAMDLVSPVVAARLGLTGTVLAIRAGGTATVMTRYKRELSDAADLLGESDDASFWTKVREFPSDFLKRQTAGVILRVSSSLTDMGAVMRITADGFIARAAAGITYVYLNTWHSVPTFMESAMKNRWNAAVEFASDKERPALELWVRTCAGGVNPFATMKKIKQMFDPSHLLNRSRLYGLF